MEITWKFAFLIIILELQLFTTSAEWNQNENNVLQVPAVKHLLFSLNQFKDTFKKKYHKAQSQARQQDGTDVPPTCKDEKIGKFEFESDDRKTRGQGEYSKSTEGVSFRIHMTIKQDKPKTCGEFKSKTTKAPPITKTTKESTTAAPPTTKATSSIDTTTDKVKPKNPTSSVTNSTTKPQNNECEDSPLIKQGLAAHNHYRSIHTAPDLKIDCTLSQQAADYAKKLADLGSLVHSGYSERPGNGENLGMECISNDSGQIAAHAVENWYDEVCKYKFNEDGPQKSTDHFTQVVWKASQQLGLGMAQKEENGVQCTYVVARYKPQGNFNDGSIGYKDNVLKGIFDESFCNTSQLDGAGIDGGYRSKRGQTKTLQ